MTPEVPVSPAVTAPTSAGPVVGLLSVSIGILDGVAVIYARGEIDMSSADSLNAAISARLAAGDDLVLDCIEVTFMDSTGITAFISARDTAERRGTQLVVVAGHPAVLRPLRISQLDSVLTIAATVAAALTLLNRHHNGA